MEINKLATPKTISVEPKNKTQKAKSTGLKEDTFNKVEVFDKKEAETFLTELKNNYDSRKFTDAQIKDIIKATSKEPEKWTYIKELAPKKNMLSFNVKEIAVRPIEDIKTAVELASINNHKNDPKFQSVHVIRILELSPEEQQNTKTLAKSYLSADNIIKAAREKDLDCKKVVKKTDEMVKSIGEDKLREITFARDCYSKGDYTLTASNTQNKDINRECLDNKLNRYAFETISEYTSKDGKSYKIQKTTDLRNNTTSKVRYELDGKGRQIATDEVRIVKNKSGKVLRTEYTQKSEIPGVMDIKYVYPNGKKEQISSGKIDKKSGITSIKKNMVSSLGTKTEYLFEDDPQGNRLSDYKITDKNGKVLLQNSETFEVIDKNHFISSKNGQKYEITADDLSVPASKYTVTVKDLNKPERIATFETTRDIIGDYKEMIKVLKKLPGEELFKLKENTTKLYGMKDVLDSFSLTNESTREIHTGDDLFVILHELGHAVDMKDVDMLRKEATMHKAIFEDKKFNEIYTKEKAAFTKAFPNAQRNHINYFIDQETHYNGKIGGKKETIAEANALLTTAKSHEVLAMRSQYLQQHFPETIAYLDKKLAEPAENPNRKYKEGPSFGWSH